jgi:hypothetical protein
VSWGTPFCFPQTQDLFSAAVLGPILNALVECPVERNHALEHARVAGVTSAILAILGAACIGLRLLAGTGTEGWADVLDLARLPEATRQTLAVLLILPAGAAITSFVRNVVGFQTFGTLMPNLLALSFLGIGWRAGAVVFAIVMLVGLSGRAVLGRLRLLIGPRLGLVLTATVLCVAATVSLAEHFGLALWAGSILLPMVVLTIVIERFHVSIEENGLAVSMRLLATTLAVSGVCLALLHWQALGRLAVRFPEGDLIVAGALILIGRYDGYRLSELWRFRDLAGSGEEPNK